VFFRGRRADDPARRTRENDMTVSTSWELFEDLRAAQHDMMAVARARGWRPGQHYDGPAAPWAPAVDISEHELAYLVEADLPGVKASEVEITFEDGLLTIKGERQPAHEAVGQKIQRPERRYGAFRRSITLPSHVQPGKIEAATQDGVLQVMVPKAPDMKAKRITVRAGHAPSAVKPGTVVSNGS
jgi:HSP20 family protein